MKTTITLRMEADLLKEAEVLAAEKGRSVNRYLAERLEEWMRDQLHRRPSSLSED